jgi:hypothetical protein
MTYGFYVLKQDETSKSDVIIKDSRIEIGSCYLKLKQFIILYLIYN